MKIRLDVNIIDAETSIQFDDNQTTIKIVDVSKFDFNIKQPALYILLNDSVVKYIGQTIDNRLKDNQTFDKVIVIMCQNVEGLEYLEHVLVNDQVSIESNHKENQKNDASEYKDKILFVLKNFGYDLLITEKKTKQLDKPHTGKARHKWTKEISKIEFTAKFRDGEGKAIWKSRSELVLLAGAKLTPNPQLNKDGTINYSSQLAQKFRDDYSDKIVDNITIVDIVFPSPNVLGIFLFYGGQNTWSELKDSNGKSLDEWSIVD